MAIDSAWIFRICLCMAVTLILFADCLGSGGANARSDSDLKSFSLDKSQNSEKGNKLIAMQNISLRYAISHQQL
jgi:hypothetical protein